MDEILWCEHLNETSLAVLLIGTIRFYVSQDFSQIFVLATVRSERVTLIMGFVEVEMHAV